MSNLVVRSSNPPKLYRKRQTKKIARKSRSKLPAFCLVVCTALATSFVALGAFAKIVSNKATPIAPSAASQDEVSEPKMPQMNPYVPVIGI